MCKRAGPVRVRRPKYPLLLLLTHVLFATGAARLITGVKCVSTWCPCGNASEFSFPTSWVFVELPPSLMLLWRLSPSAQESLTFPSCSVLSSSCQRCYRVPFFCGLSFKRAWYFSTCSDLVLFLMSVAL